MDPKLEGPLHSTPDSRAEAHKYIEEQIRIHWSIIYYYKRLKNALTITCRIPTEVLAYIFQQVVKDGEPFEDFEPAARSDRTDPNHLPLSMDAIYIASLATPNLWSTIHVECRTWAFQMLERSRGAALSVISYERINKKAYGVLKQALAAHLHRIKELFLGRREVDMGYREVDMYNRRQPRDRKSISLDDFLELLKLLVPQNGPLMIERLEMRSTAAIDDSEWRVNALKFMLPGSIIMASPSLKHLKLCGYGIHWELPHPSNSLETLVMSNIPLPALKTLSVADIHPFTLILPLHDTERIHMTCLKEIKLSCESLEVIAPFFDSVRLSKDDVSLIVFIPSTASLAGPILQYLAQKVDDATDGLVSELFLSACRIRCWKSKGKRLVGFSPPEPPAIVLGYENSDTMRTVFLTSNILQALCLDQLISLELESDFDWDTGLWTLLSGLPRIARLKVHGNLSDTIMSLCRGMHVEQSDADSDASVETVPGPDLHPAFPALTTLVIGLGPLVFGGVFYKLGIAEKLLNCVKLRAEANLPIKLLQIESNYYGSGKKGTIGVEDFKRFVDVVDWIEIGKEDTDDETDHSENEE
ncbi:hypothetical protein H0H92_011241 [Tricholoma furcatifolium]|nr:hypothetical protein H0H92_011241 [Tricholoma furcatifolium]